MKSLAAATSIAIASSLLPSGEAFASFRSNFDGLAAGINDERARRRPGSSFASTAEDDVVVATATTAAAASERSFDSFDYDSHWYPVSWARDVPINRPIRVTLFDVDYVLAKTDDGDERRGEETLFAMVDRCPHKKVALSEGRITECGEQRRFQCSYHGWTFDGETGECVEIPQTAIARSSSSSVRKPPSPPEDDDDGGGPPRTRVKRREDATAVAVRVDQGMVWLHPSRTPLEALAALEEGSLLPPPRVPEMDAEGYRATTVVRDFPIDWTVLMENIMDPDHGYFAHSSSGTGRSFDLYSADGVNNTVEVEEDFSTAGGWKIVNSVNAVQKLIEYNRNARSGTEDAPRDEAKKEPSRLATTTFVAPSLIYMGRRDNSTAPSPFLTGFWVCPTGTGRSRFMSAAIGKVPFSVPRWLVHMNINNFLDQDTFLLCGQHRAVLEREARGYLEGEDARGGGRGSNDVRKSTYVYRSPSERMPARIGRFFDATLARAPNRKEGVLARYGGNGDAPPLEPWPSREAVLDRYEQHTKICPDSMDVVRRCDGAMGASRAVALALTFAKMVRGSRASAAAAPSNPFVSGLTLAAVRRLLSRLASVVGAATDRVAARLLRGEVFYPLLALAFLSYSIASRVRREFFFKFDEELHRKDIKHIANNWVDL